MLEGRALFNNPHWYSKFILFSWIDRADCGLVTFVIHDGQVENSHSFGENLIFV